MRAFLGFLAAALSTFAIFGVIIYIAIALGPL